MEGGFSKSESVGKIANLRGVIANLRGGIANQRGEKQICQFTNTPHNLLIACFLLLRSNPIDRLRAKIHMRFGAKSSALLHRKNTLAQFETLIVYLWPSATEHNKRFSEIVSLNESALLASVLILSHS